MDGRSERRDGGREPIECGAMTVDIEKLLAALDGEDYAARRGCCLGR